MAPAQPVAAERAAASRPASAKPGRTRRPVRSWTGRRAGWSSFRWVVAAVVVVGWLVYFPVVDNFVLSTTKQDIYTGQSTFVGFGNYARLLHDPVVWRALFNNTAYAVLSIVFQVVGALVLAAMIESLPRARWRKFWRALYFVPSAISITVCGLLFYFVYQPQVGILDGVLSAFGGGVGHSWLGDPHTAIYGVIAMSQWQGFGYSTLLFAVAIQKIPQEFYDAASIDGAGPLRRSWHVTFPLVREMTGLMVIVTVTGAFQVFNEVMVMTAGGPNNTSQVLGTWLYQQGFIQNDFGYGAAIGVVVFAVTMLAGVAQLWYTRRRRVQW